jgi:O-acetyl-ADP-ribose deacetylase (regulator of RNase III)
LFQRFLPDPLFSRPRRSIAAPGRALFGLLRTQEENLMTSQPVSVAAVSPPALTVVSGDALDLLADGTITALGHQVNARGVMGAGLARAIRNRFPRAFTAYRLAWQSRQLVLGACLPVEVAPGRFIVHLVGQDGYGRGRRHTDYAALVTALTRFDHWARAHDVTPGLPYGLGCGLAGGDWTVVQRLIATAVPEALVICLDRAGEGIS